MKSVTLLLVLLSPAAASAAQAQIAPVLKFALIITGEYKKENVQICFLRHAFFLS
jgi:hypothetical protein